MIAKISQAVLVAILTVLVWAWAEGEGLTVAPASPRVVFKSPPGSDLFARSVDQSFTGAVSVNLRGSTAAVGQVQRALATPLALTPGITGFPSTPGTHTIELREIIRHLPEIRGSGVSVLSAEPATIQVTVEKLVTRQAAVRLRVVGGSASETPVMTPAIVAVRIPEANADQVPGDAEVDATVDVSSASASGASSYEATVPVRLSSLMRAAGALEPSPSTVKVAVKLGKPEETITLPSVEVRTIWDPSVDREEAKRWRVEVIDAYVRNVRLTGPAGSTAALRDGKVQPLAIVLLDSDDLKEGEVTRVPVMTARVPGVYGDGRVSAVRVKVTRAVENENKPGEPGLKTP